MSIQRQVANTIMRGILKVLCRDVSCTKREFGQLTRRLATLSVHPKECFVDETIDIRVDGLAPEQQITVKLAVEENNDVFASVAHFKADNKGTVDVTKDESIGGNYTGIMQMGMFCSLIPATGQRKGLTLKKHDITSPFNMELSVHDGYLPFETVSPVGYYDTGLCNADVKRWYMGKDVTRQTIEVSNGVYGTLFLPPGDGPFPGVIDMFGLIGGILESRASLLASKGFAALALPLFNYKDPAKNWSSIRLEYFEEASKWLANHPQIAPNGIGVVAVSKGAEIGMLMGIHCPEVKAVVSINCPPFFTLDDAKHHDKTIPGTLGDMTKAVYTDEGMVLREMASSVHRYTLYEDEMRAKVLLILCLDDQVLDPLLHIKVIEALPPEQRQLFEIVQYPGAGHQLDPPYSPLVRASHHPVLGQNFVWGGNVTQHTEAQKDSWTRILRFLTENLMPPKCV